jgi:hypothetical protein
MTSAASGASRRSSRRLVRKVKSRWHPDSPRPGGALPRRGHPVT